MFINAKRHYLDILFALIYMSVYSGQKDCIVIYYKGNANWKIGER